MGSRRRACEHGALTEIFHRRAEHQSFLSFPETISSRITEDDVQLCEFKNFFTQEAWESVLN